MKKILLSFAVAFVSLAASAQVYVGGSVGIASSKTDGSDAVTTYQFLPEVGYNINGDWAIGTTLGWGKGNPVEYEGESNNYVKVAPYARYTFVRSKYVNAFVDGGFGYTHYNHVHSGHASINEWEAGLRPGLAVNLSPKVSFVTHVGFVGWKSSKADESNAKAKNVWGASLNGNNITFGVYYNF
ncbi:outer membrane beta-barrel protein [Prevotella jejuni]|jgi:hypothetical protein|uniref:outer membrane beta-barrel protein n=1 Tax=Prevotella jejuni TaxID=1177574 RepID=UPI001BA7A152|nr:outer membrane beta-barrel protein [Prevotella jejuni]QUB80585.1 porin family protein [Prevotella jejuni]